MTQFLLFRSPSSGRRRSALLLALLTSASPLGVAWAQEAQPAQPAAIPTVLDTVTSVGDRVERPIGESTGTVTVIDADKIDKQNLHRMQDLFRDEPGINTTNDPRRAGAGSYNIRGLQDGRVLMQIDGTRLPDLPNGRLLRGGGFTPYSRDVVDFDTLKRVEVLRGPGSATYGSDALGGVVSYVTKDPVDLLSPDRNDFYSLKFGYDTVDKGFSETGTIALRAEDVSMLGIFTHRDGQEADTKATRKNPQDTSGNNLLTKIVWDGKSDRLILTGEFLNREIDTGDIQNDRTATVRQSRSEDDMSRWRLSLGHQHLEPVGFIDKIDWKVYYTEFYRRDFRFQHRINTGAPTPTNPAQQHHLYTQTNEQWIAGADTLLSSNTDWFGLQNKLTYGLQLTVTGTERLREYARYNAATGELYSVATVEGAATPSRFFPNTITTQAGLFGQDEIKSGALTVTPGVRVDYYDMDPRPDSIYRVNPTTTPVGSVTEVAVSPKLGANYDLNKTYSVYSQYARGFRAPPYDDANSGFRNPTFNYEFIPNPNLKPETSHGIEIGTRGKFNDGSSYQVAGFYNRYKNFIDMATVATAPVQQFQATNIGRVDISGFEARGQWRFLPEWALNGAGAYAVGEDKSTGRPISSVAPLTFTAGLGYDNITGDWGARIDGKHVFKHDRVNLANHYKTSSFTTVDLSAYYTPVPWMTVRAGIYNLFDETYVNYTDVLDLAPSSTWASQVPGDYFGPGRTAAINVTMRW